MKYTAPTRTDGAWDCEQEAYGDEDEGYDYGPLEVFTRRQAGPLTSGGLESRRPICEIPQPDMDGDEAECPGNIALILYAPAMYIQLKRLYDISGGAREVIGKIEAKAEELRKQAGLDESPVEMPKVDESR